jgi:6-phosphogluconolactonase
VAKLQKKLYHHWAIIKPWDHRKIKYYFGDERCVPPEHQDSNYGMVRETLFPDDIPESYTIARIKGEMSDREKAT